MKTLDLLPTLGIVKTLLSLFHLFASQRLGIVTFTVVCCVVVGGCPRAYCLAGMAAGADATDCHRSDQMHDSDKTLMLWSEAPTHFRLMSSRYVEMVQAARGYHCTGTVTVGFDGYHYFQTGAGDDPGTMELIPTLSRLTGRTIAFTYDITTALAIAAGIFIGYAGFWKLYPDRELRWIGVGVFLCFGIAEAAVADEYLFQVSPLLAGIPWLIYFAMGRRLYALTISAVSLAFVCSLCSLARTGTATICMTFLIAMFALRRRVQRPWVPCLLLILALVPSFILKRSLIARRDTALASIGEPAISKQDRMLWHTLYIGLGFIHNSEVAEYSDAVAADKVRSIDPTVAFTTGRYETILRQEVWSIVRRKPWLVIGILGAKVSIVVLLGMILLYPVRRLVFTESALVWLDGAFLLAMGMSAMNAIVAVPRASYLLTFLCLGFLYSAIKLSRALTQSRLSKVAVLDG